MGCWHGPHGCGPWYGGPYAEWSDEMDWPIRRRVRRARRGDQEMAADELEARLDELRDELRRVQAELENLHAAGRS